jgi:hypothetical protein
MAGSAAVSCHCGWLRLYLKATEPFGVIRTAESYRQPPSRSNQSTGCAGELQPRVFPLPGPEWTDPEGSLGSCQTGALSCLWSLRSEDHMRLRSTPAADFSSHDAHVGIPGVHCAPRCDIIDGGRDERGRCQVFLKTTVSRADDGSKLRYYTIVKSVMRAG